MISWQQYVGGGQQWDLEFVQTNPNTEISWPGDDLSAGFLYDFFRVEAVVPTHPMVPTQSEVLVPPTSDDVIPYFYSLSRDLQLQILSMAEEIPKVSFFFNLLFLTVYIFFGENITY